ncbi:MAG: helix-turn-helix domain-containing protein [Chloroflexota bacterium]|nr:helix-turn-helix domain-containing protein [Chloroflexota bacterium]
MDVSLTETERAELDAAAAGEGRVRLWRRYRAVQLLATGQTPAAVAATLGCSLSSVYNWATMWRDGGLLGLRGRGHGGGRVQVLDPAGERLLETLLGPDPPERGHHATGWTVPLLMGELASAGYAVGERTIRRALHRLGRRWKRPKVVLGRPDPAYEAKKRALASAPQRRWRRAARSGWLTRRRGGSSRRCGPPGVRAGPRRLWSSAGATRGEWFMGR